MPELAIQSDIDVLQHEAEIIGCEEFARRRAIVRAEEVIVRADRINHEARENPVGLNPVSSALNYIAHADVYGPGHELTTEAYRYLKDDARTALFEAITERGHVSVTRSIWDADMEGFVSGNVPIMKMLENALDGRLISAEYERRQAEIHEEAFVEAAYASGLFRNGNAVLTFSPYPDDIPETHAAGLGYKHSTKKYMIRWITVDDEGERTTKQLSMSGSDSGLITEFLRINGYYDGDKDLSSTEILGTTLLVAHSDLEGLADVARQLDQLSGDGTYMGGEPNRDSYNYECIEAVSANREKLLEQQIDSFTDSLIEIAISNVSGEANLYQAHDRYMEEFEKTRKLIARAEPELVRETIGDKSADLLLEAQEYVRVGNYDLANSLIEQANQVMDVAVICGMSVRVDSEGNVVNESGERESECKEIKNGDIVTCPGCSKKVAVIVEGANKDKLYCPRSDCSLAKASRRSKKATQKQKSAKIMS